MTCPDYDKFKSLVTSFDQAVAIDKDKDKPLRFNVWKMTSDTVKKLFTDYNVDNLPQDDVDMSGPTKRRIEGALDRLQNNAHVPKNFTQDIINSDQNIELSIALYEIAESVKGEADKAHNLDISVHDVSSDGLLPSLPLSRVAAVIGRKVAYQKGYRFKARKDESGSKMDTAKDIETLYYQTGLRAIESLEDLGYLTTQDSNGTIKDYIKDVEIGKKFAKTGVVVKGVKSVSLNTSKLGVKKDTEESAYFLNRTDSNLADTELGAIMDSLRAVRMVTQPSTVVMPDTAYNPNYDYSNMDATGVDTLVDGTRKGLYEKPLYINNAVTGLLKLLNTEVLSSGKSAVDIITQDVFKGNKPGLVKSLFGIKEVNSLSVDKKESVIGQNLSKTVPLEDLAEYYDIVEDKPLHMPLHDGRNKRLYYRNSVLNAHASKHSRYMLTPGDYEVEHSSEDFKFLVNNIAEALGDNSLSYDDFVSAGDTKLDKALKLYSDYEKGKSLDDKLGAVSYMARLFPDRDYVTLLTVMQGVRDIRSTKNGKVTTQFPVSSDATASGGTLTLTQAVGTNGNVADLLQRTGVILDSSGNDVSENGFDMYKIMSDAIRDYIANPEGKIAPDIGESVKDLSKFMSSTVDVLFGNIRDLSKSPTMTFIYGQGKKGSIASMNNDIADRVVDNLDNPAMREYVATLLGDDKYKSNEVGELKDIKGLYGLVHEALDSSGLTTKLYELLESDLKNKYLKEYTNRSNNLFKLVQGLGPDVNFKILPASAVMAGMKPTLTNLKKYGMPISKVFEVSHDIGGGDTVLTRKSEIRQSVLTVSPIHGVDVALLAKSVDKAGKGVVIVHDEVRGSVQDVRAVEEEYRKAYLESSTKYDIHSEVLSALKAYSPGIADSASYAALAKDVEATLKVKQDLFNSSFNPSTSALIGDGDSHLKFAEGAKFDATSAGIREEVSKDRKPTKDSDEVMVKLKELSADSDIISRFLDTANRASIKSGDANTFNPDSDTITVSGTDQGVGTGKKLDFGNKTDRTTQKELIEHEIVHAMSLSYIQNGLSGSDPVAKRDVDYILKSVNKLRSIMSKASPDRLSKLSEGTFDRIDYVTGSTDSTAVAELVAVLSSEPEAAKDIYGLLNSDKGLKQRIADFVKRVRQVLLDISPEDFQKAVDIEKLYSAVSRSVLEGNSAREQNYSAVVESQKEFQKSLGYGPNPGEIAPERRATLRYMNYAVSSMLNSKFERNGKRILGNTHKLLSDRFPLYVDVAGKLKGAYDSSSALQQLVHTITGEGVDKSRKADLLAKMADLNSQHMDTLNNQKELFQKELKKLSKGERDKVGEFVTKMPLHDYFILSSDLTTGAAIDAEISRIESKHSSSRHALNDVDHLIAWNIGVKNSSGEREQVQIGNLYNLASRYPMSDDSEIGTDVRKLLALKSIKELGYREFESLLANTELTSLIKDSVVANRLSMVGHNGMDNMRDSLIADKWAEGVTTRAVTSKELRQYVIGESTGWEVLRSPDGDNGLGIIYKKIIDSTHMVGAYTDIKLSSTDVSVPQSKASMDGVLATNNGYKLRLTDAEKATMGAVGDFSDALAHTTSHSMAIQDSQIIRDELLKLDTRATISNKSSEDDVIAKLDADNVDNPWFIKLGENTEFHKLDPKIRAKYQQVTNASNVRDFDKQVSLVRKDIAHWLVGDNVKPLFANIKLQWATRIVKDLVAGAKLGMVVLNPVKIANDNLSNLAYLGTMGADPIFITKNYKDIAKAYGDYAAITDKVNSLRVQLAANPDNKALKRHMDSLIEKSKNTSIGDIAHKGFMNSLGSDIIHQNADTASGLQADMHTAIEYLTKTKKGNKNVVSEFITRASNIGWHSEDFIKYVGGIAGRFDTTKGAEAELDKVYDRLSQIRTEADINNYAAQYTTSPSSELVKIGGKVTDLTDVLAKETLYRHFTQNEGMADEAARIKVLDSFPDYKENMPLAIKQMSDAGIIMFPSFWLRIQKVIYRMVRDKPISFGTELMLQDMLGSNVNTIVGSNVVEKAGSFGGIFHTPFEHTGINSVLPSHLL